MSGFCPTVFVSVGTLLFSAPFLPLELASPTDGVGAVVRFNREYGKGPNIWSVEDFYAPVHGCDNGQPRRKQ